MTIKMLIVDDEPIISQGLRMTIPWASYGVEVIGEAYNGKEATEILLKEEVDIVLTDVRMPEMDGIQLAQFIKERMPHIQVIIISGYDEFDYAREALRYQVKDYLLKPVDIDELVAKVKELKESILHERVQRANEYKIEIRDTLSKLILTPQLHFSYVNQDLLQGRKYCVVVSEIPNYAALAKTQRTENLDEMREEWDRKLSQVFKEAVTFFVHANVHVLVVPSDGLVQEALKNTLLESGLELVFGISSLFEDPSDVSKAYKQGVEALATKELTNENVLFYKEKKTVLPNIDYTFLYETLFNYDFKVLEENVNDIFENMKLGQYSLIDMRDFCYELNIKIEQKLQGLLSVESLDDVTYQVTHELDLHFYNTSDCLKEVMLSDLQMWIQVLEEENQGKKSWSVEKAIKYIGENFYRDLKASEVANEIHITHNYFSMIFKKELGKSFNDYLNDLRIEKAMQLLTETSDRVYEIATEVGYSEYKYFVQVFRKRTGMTPTDYRMYKGIEKN